MIPFFIAWHSAVVRNFLDCRGKPDNDKNNPTPIIMRLSRLTGIKPSHCKPYLCRAEPFDSVHPIKKGTPELIRGFLLFIKPFMCKNPELTPGFLRRGIPSGNAAESEAFPDIAAGIVQVAVDRTQFTGAV